MGDLNHYAQELMLLGFFIYIIETFNTFHSLSAGIRRIGGGLVNVLCIFVFPYFMNGAV